MAENMWRNYWLASLLLILGATNLILLNVWLVPSTCPPSGDPITTATTPDVLERTPEVEETPVERGTAERVSEAGLEDGSADGARMPQVADVVTDSVDAAVELEKKVERSTESEASGTTAAVEPISASQESGKTEHSSAEPRYRTLHHAVVQFFFDGDVLKSAARDILVETARIYKEHPDAEVQVDGHTDRHGSEDYNYRLSEQRARTIAAILEAEGIPSARIKVHGHGPSQPLDIRNNMAASAKNRRVEITIRSRLP